MFLPMGRAYHENLNFYFYNFRKRKILFCGRDAANSHDAVCFTYRDQEIS